ncbi:galactose-specific lectin nattectin-like [Parambassis ranga]|uniref:Galactose-specific lectin nattectin-like n=1 Tax=Parambassis ranga TaxID=210632 RepID=A0A6P7JVG9_9TELE|nr:galactose-specific lectin nattectin-like [Parambassis ranga]
MVSGFHLVCLCWISSLLTGCMSASIDVPVPGCPPGWTQFQARCFSFQNRQEAMADAESICLSLGGNLASIHSITDNMFLRELVHTASGSYSAAWVGGHDGVKEGQWMWTDGSKFDYQIWGQGEPNNVGEEDCLHINFRGEYWNDGQCHWRFPFICAKDL